MTFRIQLVEGLEGTPKRRTTIGTADAPDAASALLATLPLPAGWRFRVLTPMYAAYLAPDDTPRFCHAYISIRNPALATAAP